MENVKSSMGVMMFIFAWSVLLVQPSWGAVSAEEAKQLGTTLTEFGAEKAGNKDGSIPAYTGGVEKVLGYDPGTSRKYVDPFAGEKPLYSVDAKNMEQYADMLTEGTKAVMRLHDDYRIDIYPTHRSIRYADWVLENTLKNATTVKLAGKIEGDTVEGADKNNLPYRGIPFPIPKNGYEVMWNNYMKHRPAVVHLLSTAFLVDTSGRVSSLPNTDEWYLHPWNDVKDYLRPQTYNCVWGFSALLTAPPASAGIVFLNFYTPDLAGQKVWFYTPGQRRIRRAPEFAYDVPVASYGGALLWDEVGCFVGRMDRFDFKLVGKKEMLVPYNVFGPTNNISHEEYLGPKFVKPETMRFEKHRVWVVDATRKSNARHVYSRRTFYLDEDSWSIVATESYDDAGEIYRVFHSLIYPTYDIGGINAIAWICYDIIKGNYAVINVTGDEGDAVRSYDTGEGLPINLTPAAVEAAGVR